MEGLDKGVDSGHCGKIEVFHAFAIPPQCAKCLGIPVVWMGSSVFLPLDENSRSLRYPFIHSVQGFCRDAIRRVRSCSPTLSQKAR